MKLSLAPLMHNGLHLAAGRRFGHLLAPSRGRAAPEAAETSLHAGITAAAVAAGFHRWRERALVCRSPERRRTVAMAGHLLPVVLHRSPAAIRRRCCSAHEHLLAYCCSCPAIAISSGATMRFGTGVSFIAITLPPQPHLARISIHEGNRRIGCRSRWCPLHSLPARRRYRQGRDAAVKDERLHLAMYWVGRQRDRERRQCARIDVHRADEISESKCAAAGWRCVHHAALGECAIGPDDAVSGSVGNLADAAIRRRHDYAARCGETNGCPNNRAISHRPAGRPRRRGCRARPRRRAVVDVIARAWNRRHRNNSVTYKVGCTSTPCWRRVTFQREYAQTAGVCAARRTEQIGFTLPRLPAPADRQ